MVEVVVRVVNNKQYKLFSSIGNIVSANPLSANGSVIASIILGSDAYVDLKKGFLASFFIPSHLTWNRIKPLANSLISFDFILFRF